MREAIRADEQAWGQVMDATESEFYHEELWLGRASDAGTCSEGVWNHYHHQIQLGQRLKFREARMTRYHMNVRRN